MVLQFTDTNCRSKSEILSGAKASRNVRHGSEGDIATSDRNARLVPETDVQRSQFQGQVRLGLAADVTPDPVPEAADDSLRAFSRRWSQS